MKKDSKKNKKIFGYIIILLGLIILAFPIAKRFYSDIENKMVYEKVLKSQAEEDKEILDEVEKRAIAYNETIKDSDISMTDPFEVGDFGSKSILDNPDDIFAYIEIPKLGKVIPIYLDASYDHIAWGLGQVSGSSIPVGGESTRSVLAGHRGWWGDTMLLYADDLVNGDLIYIKRADRTLTYKVFSKEVIGPFDWESLRIEKGEDIITLLTCHPFFWPRPNRLLVNARRVEDEKNPTENQKTEKIEVSENVKITNYIYVGFMIIDFILIIFVVSRIIKLIKNRKIS
ncbi:class C sortase [Anaerococcus sp. WCA-380-WT-2B]|uniref:Class C sortase n=1 Tax=Anaerococcus porci TaxID=2652269 RepID=A0A6N7VRD8_9FIRM|nr:class C sortase [Anaerococcus porci]MSS77426.1 class C sortase [Anaerococcus porci]